MPLMHTVEHKVFIFFSNYKSTNPLKLTNTTNLKRVL